MNEKVRFMDAANKSRIGIIILAAGASTRLGQPKQLLKFRNKTLIRHAVETALATECEKIIVVLGENADEIKKQIEDLPIEIADNKNWQSGMSSSIKTGLEKLYDEELSAVVFMLCDQPLISSETILHLIETQAKTQKKIVASEYKNDLGVPAGFSHEVFEELLNLQGDTGAKFLIKKYFPSDSAKISAPEAEFDIDTLEDYQNLQSRAE